MTAYIDSIPVASAKPDLSSKAAKRAQRARDARDLGLLNKAGRGDQEAAAQLAGRLAPRVQLLARALMGGSLDAEDAALHALVELLRSRASYRAKEPIERWAERCSAFSVMRFARAVGRRSASTVHRDWRPRDERTARTFEQYLQALSDSARQTLLLRHALGLTLAELAEGLQCPVAVAGRQLLAARAELRGLVRRRGNEPPVLGARAVRWCAQRDREAIGQVLSPAEQTELAELEARDAEVWAYVAQVRALEHYFNAPRGAPSLQQGGTLAARAVAALGVTTPALRASSAAPEAIRPARDLEGNRVIRWMAVGASFLLAFATAAALLLYRPPPRPGAEPAGQSRLLADGEVGGAHVSDDAATVGVTEGLPEFAPAHLAPTVESLPSKASTAQRGGRLRRTGRVLGPGAQLSEGDVVEAFERNGCLQVEPGTTVCLALGSVVRLVSLASHERELELTRGRAVVRLGTRSEPARLTLRAGALEVSAVRAAFGVERTFDGKIARARSLRGDVDVRVGDRVQKLDERTSALCRSAEDLVLVPAVAAAAQRDWEVLATGLQAASAARPEASALGAAEAHETSDAATPSSDRKAAGDPSLAAPERGPEPAAGLGADGERAAEGAAFGGEQGEF